MFSRSSVLPWMLLGSQTQRLRIVLIHKKQAWSKEFGTFARPLPLGREKHGFQRESKTGVGQRLVAEGEMAVLTDDQAMEHTGKIESQSKKKP